MEELRRLELRVGVIAVAAIALFLLGITWARGVRLGVPQQEFRLRFPTVAGLEPGAPVFIHGVRQGSVVALEPQADSVVVYIRVEGGVRLRRDATARIGLQELTGGRKVDIFPGTDSEPLTAGAEIPGTVAPEVAELLEMFAALGEDTRRVVTRLDTTVMAVSQLLRPETRRLLQQVIEDLAVLSQRLRTLAEEHGAALERTAENAAMMSTELRELISHQRPAVESTLQSLQRSSAAAERVVVRADSLVSDFRRAADQLLMALDELQTGTSLAARFLKDEKLARQVDSTLFLLRDFVERVQQHGINVNVRLGTRP
ncbi:MAG: MlaD family protein [Candidatus Kapabacteria bacterium]|nr:MlaD family protein [Candidatus Kapabacteria bacterium]MCS7170156.1 MlaD family protein [Candidatus Kapabacteria bacterium]MDW7996831.1 MlaD family protein [Bacteroidota bacterium]MDW8225277.1 MlaD family protein [Bacteroidota bacterium]